MALPQNTGAAELEEPEQHSGEELVSSAWTEKEILNEEDDCSDRSGSEGLEGKESEEDE